MNGNTCADNDVAPGEIETFPGGVDGHLQTANGSPDTCDGATEVNDVFGTGDCGLSTDYKYGWFSWHPKWLQTLNKPKWLLVCLCFYTFVQGLVINGFINVVISTLELRFNLPSKQSGLIASTYDISSALLVVFVSYYGGRGHKAKWLAFGCVIMAVGSLVFALPHFATGLYSNLSGSLVCEVGSSDKCQPTEESDSSPISNYLFVFLVSQVLHGIGCTPLYSIGITLIDESVNVHQSALYLGIFLSVASLGPALGYVLGGLLLNIYTDVDQMDVESLAITPSDPNWVGAWWLGFLIGGTIAFFVAVPISGYPKELPSTARIRARKVSQAHVSPGVYDVTRTGFGAKLSDFPRALKCLFMNAPYVCLVIVAICKGAFIAGFSTFGPKVIETQFGKSTVEASLLFGLCAIPGCLFGTMIGGYVVKRWQLKVRGMLRFSCCCCLVALVSFSGILLYCPEEHMVGVNADYYGNMTVPGVSQLENDCNAGCGCTMNDFHPVCGDNGLEYFDACFAGCTEKSEDSEIFEECRCLKLSAANTTMTAFAGKCHKDCGYLPFYLLAFGISSVFQFMASIPCMSAMLRCVPDSQRSLAMGVNWVFIRILGSIPAPILIGVVLDSSCILWQQDCNGDQGSCFLYSATTVSWKLYLIGISWRLVGIIFLFTALRCYKSPEDETERNEDKTDHDNNKNDKMFFKGIQVRSSPKPVERMLSNSSQLGIISNERIPDNTVP